MSLSCALPLGHPPASLPAASRTARLSLLQSLLDRGTDTFSGDSTLHTYRFRNAGAPAWAKQVFTPWSGTLARQADGSLTGLSFELDLSALGQSVTGVIGASTLAIPHLL